MQIPDAVGLNEAISAILGAIAGWLAGRLKKSPKKDK